MDSEIIEMTEETALGEPGETEVVEDVSDGDGSGAEDGGDTIPVDEIEIGEEEVIDEGLLDDGSDIIDDIPSDDEVYDDIIYVDDGSTGDDGLIGDEEVFDDSYADEEIWTDDGGDLGDEIFVWDEYSGWDGDVFYDVIDWVFIDPFILLPGDGIVIDDGSAIEGEDKMYDATEDGEKIPVDGDELTDVYYPVDLLGPPGICICWGTDTII
jgi:hypothetical protein